MSESLNAKVLIVGGGPGGYVAAIRAGQLGLDTVLVEADRLGGTCLIRGCIPSKALIHAASTYAALADDHTARMGIMAGESWIDMAQTVRWKDSVVDKLNGGVTALLKRAKVRVVDGWATFQDGKTCIVETASGPLTITAEHVILANGSVPVELPFLPFGETVISSTEALCLTEVPSGSLSSAPATSAWNWDLRSASWAPTSQWWKPPKASCRSSTTTSPRRWRAG